MDEIAKQVGMGIAANAVGVVKYDAMEFVIRKSVGAASNVPSTLRRHKQVANKHIGLHFGR